MKNDYGVAWGRKEYLMAMFIIILFLTVLTIPPIIMLSVVSVIGFEYVSHVTIALMTIIVALTIYGTHRMRVNHDKKMRKLYPEYFQKRK